MTNVEECFTVLVNNVVLGQKLPNNFIICNLTELYRLSKKHDMAHIVAYGLKENGLIDFNTELWTKCYKKQYSLAQFRVTNLQYEYEKVCQVLECVGIDYIPLKGAVLRKLYPEPWMRVSTDIDILVKPEDLQSAEQHLIKELNYTLEKGDEGYSHHDHLKTPSGFTIELHFILSEKNTKATPYLNKVWEKATLIIKNKHMYKLDDDMFYFYHVFHASVHFKSGGCGFRTILDTWIINSKLGIDSEENNEMLAGAGLLKFATQLEKIAKKWFDNSSETINPYIESFIFNGGLYGGTNKIVTEQAKTEGNSLKYYIKRIFPEYSFLCLRYKGLRGKPLLLPIYWVIRIFTIYE